MIGKDDLSGSMPALVTPMETDGQIDWSALERLINWHVDEGSSGIVVVGTTGESATLEFNEHRKIIAETVRMTAGRIPLIAGTGSNSTQEAIGLSQEAERAGADALLLITPYYNMPTQKGLYQHYRAVAEAVKLPIILYNVPTRTAVDMLPETLSHLAEIDNIIAIKEATGDIARGEAVMRACGDKMTLLSGDDFSARELMLAGAQGTISVTANVAPRLMAQMCQAACSGQRSEAEALDHRLAGLHRSLFLESNPIPVKWALAEMKLIGPRLRLPLTPLSSNCQASVRDALTQAGIEI